MILTNARLATMNSEAPYGLGDTAAPCSIAIAGNTIAWLGHKEDLPEKFENSEKLDLGGRLVTPGLIDCHTHIVHGGDRAKEFEMRLLGASYEEIARAGGGIVSTVSATRAARAEDLLAAALKRVDALIAEGVTTLEIKSGYGLDLETELRMLRVARAIGEHRPINVVTSFLGAHAVPQEFKGRADAYIQNVCIPALQAAHDEGLVDAVDGFCEGIAFDPDQIERVFKAAIKLGLPVKLHAEQLSNLGGIQLALNYNALSVDHIEYASLDDVASLSQSDTVAVILPGAFYTLHETRSPPIELMRQLGVPMAVATDCNPGSSPMSSLLLAMNMACTLFKMTPQEALQGVTSNAAKALGMTTRGRIEPGLRADLAIWDVQHPAELSYRIGFNPLHARIFGGRLQ